MASMAPALRGFAPRTLSHMRFASSWRPAMTRPIALFTSFFSDLADSALPWTASSFLSRLLQSTARPRRRRLYRLGLVPGAGRCPWAGRLAPPASERRARAAPATHILRARARSRVSHYAAEAAADAPFADLPQAMVREMLGSSRRLAGGLAADISSMRSMRGSVRESLAPLLGRDSDLPGPESPPSTAGVDGSHCAERMLATDIVAMGAVAVEGLGSARPGAAGGGERGAGRLWPRPRHFVHVESLAHDDANPVAARAVMAAMEVQLASLAPHDIVFVDGSLATPAIALDIALRQRGGGPPSLARYLEEGEGEGEGEGGEVRFGPIERTLSGYLRMLAPDCGIGGAYSPSSRRRQQTVAAVAKYSQRSEICERLGLPNLDDRGLLSLVLDPGEYVGPFTPERPAGRGAPGAAGGRLLSGRVPGGSRSRSLAEAIADAVNAVRVLYYRPHAYSPAIRLEVGGFGAGRGGERDRTGALLEAVRLQSAGPGLMEPYPVYMADRMAKSLPRALPAMRGIAASAMARTWPAGQAARGAGGMGVAELYIAARGYRT